jgi:hypothetical protein
MPRSSTRRLAWVPLPHPGGPNRIRFIRSLPSPRSCAGTPSELAVYLRPPRSLDFLISPSYWCASRCDWICAALLPPRPPHLLARGPLTHPSAAGQAAPLQRAPQHPQVPRLVRRLPLEDY